MYVNYETKERTVVYISKRERGIPTTDQNDEQTVAYLITNRQMAKENIRLLDVGDFGHEPLHRVRGDGLPVDGNDSFIIGASPR